MHTSNEHPQLTTGWRQALWLGLAVLPISPLLANPIGGEKPSICLKCSTPATYSFGSQGGSLTEGNLRDDLPISSLMSWLGKTLDLDLTYNSYNADGSHGQVDTGMGYGWTHAYNSFLFSQVGAIFRMDQNGRTEKFQAGPGGTYTSDTGYFETLVKNPDGSFTLTDKNQKVYQFATVPGTPFAIDGPVSRLQSIIDRNGNTITFGYAGGNLTQITDVTGRSLMLGYNSSSHLTSVTDPLGRTTTFGYDATGRNLSSVTDPNGRVTRYTYNALHQITSKVDRDGRTFYYQYQGNLPTGIKDSSGQPLFSLSNPANWGTSQSQLAANQERVYTPSTTSQTDGRGNVWKYQYDANAYTTNTIAPDGSQTSYTYDPATLGIASKTDANGHTTTYQYDPQGNRTNVTDALGNVTTYTYEPNFNQITSMTDPNGRTTTYKYDSRGNRTNETDALSLTESWTYDSHGDVLSFTDKRGFTTTYQYDNFLDRTNTTDPLGNVTSYAYDAVGNLTSTTDPLGHTTVYHYDGLNRRTNQVDALGNTTTYSYNAEGNLLQTVDPNGNVTSYQYDLRNRMVTRTNAIGGRLTTTYDGNNNVTRLTDENGHVTTYAYDTQNRRTSTTDALHEVTQTAYDPVGNVTSSTDPDGNVTSYTYDALNRKISRSDALGNTTLYDYANTPGLPCCGATAGSDLITERIDANGKITFYNYDELNRRVQEIHKSGGNTDVINPTDWVTTTAYDADNDVISVTDPNGNTTRYTYDSLDRLIGSTNAAGDVTATVYDAAGRVSETVAPNNNVTTTVYDAVNRVIQLHDGLGVMYSESYDAAGNLLQVTDANSSSTTYAYDPLNRVTSATDALGHTRSVTYDAVGNILSVTDRDGNVTVNVYDAVNRLVRTTDPLGHHTTTTYDAAGNRVALTDPAGHTTTYHYDPDNRLIQQTYPDKPADTLFFTYDRVGHRVSRLDQNGVTTTYTYNDFYYLTNRHYTAGPSDNYLYDLGGRMLSAERGGWVDMFTYDGANRVTTAVQNGKTVSYSYNIAAGTRTIGYPGGQSITEQTDLRNRLSAVEDGLTPPISQFAYDAANRVLTRTNRNGTLAAYTYDAANRLLALDHTNGAGLFAGSAYAYDHEGNPLYENRQDLPTHSQAYAYDLDYRLTNFDLGTLSGNTIPSPAVAESWTLDPMGNWLTNRDNASHQSRTFNAVNELLTINTQVLTYDANGNLIADGQYDYAYDAENRLVSVTRISDSRVMGQYTYDALGHRVIKVADPTGTAVTTVYFYDGPRRIEDENIGGVTLATYTYGNYVDEVLTMDQGGTTYYYHPNARYTVEALTDSTGNPAERYIYDAYGFVTVWDGAYNPVFANAWGAPHSAVGNPFLFTGRELDEESGLYFYRARYYDSIKGRWLQRDPVGYEGGLNLYEYVHSEPTRGLDPEGTACVSVERNYNIRNPTTRLPPFFVGPVPVTLSYYAQIEAGVKSQTCDVTCPNGQPGQSTELTLSATGKVGVSATVGFDVGFQWSQFEVSAWAGLRGEAELGLTLKGTYTQCTCRGGPRGIKICGEAAARITLRGGGQAVLNFGWWSYTVGAEVFATLAATADVCLDWTGNGFQFLPPTFRGFSGEYGARISFGGTFTYSGTF